MQLEKRIEMLEQILMAKNGALPFFDFDWEDLPAQAKLTFAVLDEVIEQGPEESSRDYMARSMELCRQKYLSRIEFPVIKIYLPV
ncbi:hypothetical protein [Desulfonatronovibrio hydrogenovorans]|uniref:hypothetical protein n=1 Tax=Desulfonatronovibrio hydrogenovorans TaxID=53245 RepID=UPI00048BDEB4|nr:hypothetical protein [Desulfonatronovibrio hydrogenovorans]